MLTQDSSLRLRKAVAAQIRRRRVAAELSQEELGYRAGLHRTYISQVERAKKALTIDSLQKIAEALGVEPAVLLETCEPPTAGPSGGKDRHGH